MKKAVIRGVATIALFNLAACGGGGGGGETAPPVTPPPPTPTSFDLSGQILIPSFTQVDVDVADSTGSTNNDTLTASQAVSNPSIVGGYLSAEAGSHTQAFGSFDYRADGADVYRVSLLNGQTVSLTVFDAYDYDGAPTHTDPAVVARLLLASDESELAAETMSTGSVTFDITQTADYYIELTASGGPVTYSLTVGTLQTSAAVNGAAPLTMPLDVHAEFVPGEVLIRYRPQQTQRLAADEQPLPGYFVQRFGADGTDGLLKLQDTQASPGFRALAGRTQTDQFQAWTRQETLNAVAALRQRPDIAWAEPNYIRRKSALTDNPFYSAQWHYPLINLPNAWEVPDATGNDVIVAVLDTGILPTHPDLQGQLVTGCDFVSSTSLSLDGDGIDENPTDPGDSTVGESSFHGTHVAGTVVAANNSVGGVGVAYDAKVMALRVLGKDGSGTDADLIQAIRFAAGLSNNSSCTLSRRADIINMSLGGSAASSSLRAAVDAAEAAGVILVAAAGNENSTTPSYPAAYGSVISVSAVGPNLARAPYSNMGSTIDVAAPGGNMLNDLTGDGRPDGILSTWADDSAGSPVMTYALMQGTSMASPHVAGVAAIMASIRRAASQTLTPSEFRSYLENGDLTVDIGASGKDSNFGYGLIDAVKAVRAVDGVPFPTLSADVASLYFTQSGDETITLTIPSGVTAVSASAATLDGLGWLSVNDMADANDTTYQVVVDSTGLELGVSYPGEIVFDYTADNDTVTRAKSLSIRVTLSRPDPAATVNAGRHYALLISASTSEVSYQDAADASGGVYAIAFPDVDIASYELVAGTDLDNDGFICDQGEACGEYPVRNLPETIKVGSDRDDLDFSTGFSETVNTSASTRTGSGPAGYRHRPLP
ncbi:MAG: S8 family serine peptidase [Hahellaceae bacterium]|nr:S8 family serine peptidase [Hahellaceae bacterium]